MKPTDARIDVLGELFVVGWAGFGEAVRDGIRPSLRDAVRRLDEANAIGVPGMTVDGDVLGEAIAEALPRDFTDEAARRIAGHALDNAVRAGMTVLHGTDLHAREVPS